MSLTFYYLLGSIKFPNELKAGEQMTPTIKSHYDDSAVRKEVSICRRHVPDIAQIAESSIRTISFSEWQRLFYQSVIAV